ncbi:hypothetical protein Glove_372g139 [Diversispora epigaea]|uniref:C2H2-type domain-containing protein n=1 Tax=Diversispora epigaea TaxID=1348612 RepID=A0A397H696_9GLOM|nr:hypothetical protein Glove_372g139 [Diversispora epigaea]
MSTNFQCEYCNHYYASRNAYAQHVGRCIKTVICSSTEESEEPEVESIREFPNETYADLMTLVIENNLSNKAGNAIIKFFNKHSDLPQLSPLPKNIETGRKTPLYNSGCIHNGQEYFIHYRPIKNCIENLLSNPEILKHFMFKYENSEEEKSYGEQNSGNWWKYAEESISSSAFILSIILYSDATTTDTLGKNSLHPIYLSLGNIPTWRRNKEDAKQLLRYFSILSAKNKTEKESSDFKKLARKTFHDSIKFLLDPLFQGNGGVDFNIDGKDIPYRLSNKKDVEKQIMENIRCRTIVMRNRVKKTKTPVVFTYTAKLFDFNFSEAIINEHRDNPKLNKNMSKGFAKFIDCLNSYLKLLNTTSEDCQIKIYSSVTLKNGAILRAEEKSYGEQNSGNWWKYAEESISSSAFILSIILYSDATTTDTLGKNSLHPIYLSLGNIPTWRRNKEDAKQLLRYFSILSAKNKTEKESSDFKKLARKTFHDSIKFLLDPLFQGNGGVDFNIDGKDVWFFLRISTIICDWPEACTFSLTYKSANSNYPCHFCLVQKEDLIDIRKDQLILRDHVNMKEYFNNSTNNSAGLEQVDNYFWNILNLNIYTATVPDRMHHLDLGLFKYQIEFTTELLKLKPGKLVDDMNKRIAKIPRHSGLKVFKKGVQSLSRLTASEYRDMMKIMVFVVDGLYSEDLSNVYVKWNEIYLLSRLENFKESDLQDFQKAINDWGNIFIKLFRDISRSNLKFPKLHSWIYHIVDTIREHGAINGYTTETYESLHKTYVKIPYRLSNKKDVEKQIMENIRCRAIVMRNRVKKTKTPVAFTYTAKLFDFNFSEAIINEHRDNPKLNKNMSKVPLH